MKNFLATDEPSQLRLPTFPTVVGIGMGLSVVCFLSAIPITQSISPDLWTVRATNTRGEKITVMDVLDKEPTVVLPGKSMVVGRGYRPRAKDFEGKDAKFTAKLSSGKLVLPKGLKYRKGSPFWDAEVEVRY